MKVLELFCGTKSISKAFSDSGHQTFTVDNAEWCNANLTIDVGLLNINDLPKPFKKPDVIWASPPCTTFSVASISKHWDKDTRLPKSNKARESVRLIYQMLWIIRNLKPRYFFIENPRGMLRKLPMMQDLRRVTLTYCQYGDTRMKPTDIWTNHPTWTPKCCKNGMSCHESAPRGSRSGTQGLKNNMERSRIPRLLCEEIVKITSEGVDIE